MLNFFETDTFFIRFKQSWVSINVSEHTWDGSMLKPPITIWLSLSLYSSVAGHSSKRSLKHSSRHSPVTSKVSESTCIDEDADRTSRDIGTVPIFLSWDFKASHFRLKSPGLLNKNIHNLQVLKFQVDRSASMMKLF